MKYTHLLHLLVAAFAVFLTSCGGCGQPGFGRQGFGPGFGGGFGRPPRNMAPPWAAAPFYGGVQNNGSMAWDGRSNVVRFPQSAQQFGSVNGPLPVQGGFNPPLYGPMTGGRPGFQGGGAPRLVPSGRTVTCPGCRAPISNAPSGTFACQRCNTMVHN